MGVGAELKKAMAFYLEIHLLLWSGEINMEEDPCQYSYWNLKYSCFPGEVRKHIHSWDPCMGRLGVKLTTVLIAVVIRMFYRGGPIASREVGSQMCRLQVFGLIDSS